MADLQADDRGPKDIMKQKTFEPAGVGAGQALGIEAVLCGGIAH